MQTVEIKSRIAGVSFNNDPEDGGRNRQQILAELFGVNKIITVNLKHTTFKNEQTGQIEPAIKCIERSTKQVIGWIPREDIAKMKGVRQLTGFIRFIRDGYSVELESQIAPSSAQYKAVKNFCDNHNRVMPAYDTRAYGAVFAEMRAN